MGIEPTIFSLRYAVTTFRRLTPYPLGYTGMSFRTVVTFKSVTELVPPLRIELRTYRSLVTPLGIYTKRVLYH